MRRRDAAVEKAGTFTINGETITKAAARERLRRYVASAQRSKELKANFKLESATSSTLEGALLALEAAKLHDSQSNFGALLRDQIKVLRSKSGRCKWDPLIMEACLDVHRISPKALDALRASCLATVPCERTMRAHANTVRSSSGFSRERYEEIGSEVSPRRPPSPSPSPSA